MNDETFPADSFIPGTNISVEVVEVLSNSVHMHIKDGGHIPVRLLPVDSPAELDAMIKKLASENPSAAKVVVYVNSSTKSAGAIAITFC